MIREDEVRGAVLCVKDIVRGPHFTQRSFFSDSGVTMFAESSAICDSITNSAVFEPWTHAETASRAQVLAEVCACLNQAVDRRMAVKNLQEQWYAVGSIRSSSEGSASRSGVRISTIVEEGLVEYVSVRASPVSVPGPSNCVFPRGNPKRRKSVEAL